MHNPFLVKTVVFASGERFPVLIERESGIPIFYPTIYCVSAHRARNKASNTIEQVLRSIMLMLMYQRIKKIDLSKRFVEGKVLDVSEIDELISICKKYVENIDPSTIETDNPKREFQKLNFEKVRQLSKQPVAKVVRPATHANRIRNIRDYLKWEIDKWLLRNPSHINLRLSWNQCNDILNARIPSVRSITTIGNREGLSKANVDLLLEIIDPSSEKNPWLTAGTKERNIVIVLWFLSLGIRRGELLNIKISDIDTRKNLVTIARRADDATDPRRKQPLVKTRDRVLELNSALVEMTLKYIFNVRNKHTTARKHQYLFVSKSNGQPLSLSAVNKIFSEIRDVAPNELKGLSPHVLRHTWNEIFSEQCDESGIDKETEIEARKYSMGWKDSATAAIYLRRVIANVSRKVSLSLQEKIFNA